MAYARVLSVEWTVPETAEEMQEAVRRMRDEGMPALQQLPGFLRYTTVRTSDTTTITLTEWESLEHLETGRERLRSLLTESGIGRLIARTHAQEGRITLQAP